MTNEQILGMISMRMNGATLEEIGDKYGVTSERVRQCIPTSLGRSFRIEKGYENVVYPALKKWLIKNKVSKTQFAKRAGIFPQNMDQFLRGEIGIRKSSIDKILAITGMTYEQAFAKEDQE